jgi:hypothetical protein
LATPVAALDILTDQPAPRLARWGLFDAADIIDTKIRVVAQVAWSTDACVDGGLWHLCNPVDPAPEGQSKSVPGVTWYGAWPFAVYAGASCLRTGFPDAVQRARRRLELTEQRLVERALWTGEAGASPHFGGPETVKVHDGQVDDVASALALLEEALAETTAAQGLIHVPRRLAAALAREHLILLENGKPYSPAGNQFVFGAGYASGPAANDALMYATGPVVVRRGDAQVHGGDNSAGFNPRTNESTAIAERAYLVTVDCPIFSVSVKDSAPPATKPADVKNVKVTTASDHSLTVTWDPVPGATGYVVEVVPATK